MKKSYKWPHDKWDENEHPTDQPRQRSNTEEPRRFSKNYSSRREDYFEGENKSVNYQRNSYQMERRSKTTIQTFQAIPPRFEALNKHNSKKVNCTMNSTEKQQNLNDVIKSTKKSDPEENYKVRQGFHPLCPVKGNSDPDSKIQIFKGIFSKPVDLGMKFENEFLQVDGTKTECVRTRRNSSEISINEENSSNNKDVKHIHSSNENSLPVLQRYSTSFYESNQSTQYYSKQYNDQSNTNSHDLSKNNVYAYEERPDIESDNTCNDFQRTAFLSCSAPHERHEFSMLKLTDLLYYNVNFMQDQTLFNFSTAIKCKIVEAIDRFPFPIRDELETLCEITDGDQSEKNQQIITTRICCIVRNIIEKFPHVINILETLPTPPNQVIYQTVPNLHSTTNICNSDNKLPYLKIVQNSEVLLTSATDCNFMSDYKIVQNDKCVISKTTSDSFDNTNSNDYKDGYEIHNFNTSDVKNNSTSNSPLIVEENENIVEESSRHHSPPPVNSGEHKPVNRFSFNEDDNCFAAFELDKLIKFNINAMHGDIIFKYAFLMKQKILEKIDFFNNPYKDKLKLLCELTDGTQREHNQKLINERMSDLINDFQEEIGEHCWKIFLDEHSKNVCSRRSQDENEMLHAHRQNIDGQSRKMEPRRSHDENEMLHEYRQNMDGQSRKMEPRRSHDKNEMLHRHRQNIDGQSRKMHPRRSHDEDEEVHEHRQNFIDEGPHEVDHEHRRNFSDVQSRSHEVMLEYRQKFSDEQPRNVHLRRSRDEVVHEHNQNFSDGQSRNAHPRQSHNEEMYMHRQKFSDEQPGNVHPRRSRDEVVHDEHNQNFSDGQSRNADPRQSHDEEMHVHRQNFTDEQSKKVQSKRLYYREEIVQHEHRRNFSDGQSRNVHLRRSRY